MPAFEFDSLADLWLRVFAIVAGASILSTGIGIAFERTLGDRVRIWSVGIRDGQLRHEIKSYVVFVLLLTTCASLWLSAGLVSFGATGAAQAALTFAVLWTAFEIYYYGLHRALHSKALYRFHAHHHESHVTTSWTGQSLGLVEGLGWIAGLLIPPALMSLVAEVSVTGCLIYFFANTFVNLVGHANIELSPISARALTWLNHPWVYHALHHARFKNNYSFASTFMDRLFGTEWDDWQQLHGRVVGGQPMSRLNERGTDHSA